MDIVLQYEGKYLGIETKYQETSGTAYQKLEYALADTEACPIPTIIVFAGEGIQLDMKSRLVTSGKGIEVKLRKNDSNSANDMIEDLKGLLKQRIYIELGLDWF